MKMHFSEMTQEEFTKKINKIKTNLYDLYIEDQKVAKKIKDQLEEVKYE